jgi:hypothetical protein
LQPAALYVQDEPTAFSQYSPVDDTPLEHSFRHDIETVPTLIRVQGGREVARAVGWVRDADDATALITEVSGENVATKDGGVSSRYVFTAAQAGQADMGFRQVTLVNSGAVPLAKTGVVRVTVN